MEREYRINEIAFKISSFALQAALYEAACFPSLGLVSPVSRGAHRDMNYYMFIDSISELNKYYILLAQAGFSKNSACDVFEIIRKIGMDAEKSMFQKTGGINTHKGNIFLMGIACAATSKAIYEGSGFEAIREIIKDMCRGLVKKELESLEYKEGLTYGEKLYLELKIEGPRGEAERGLPVIFDVSLPLYESCSDLSLNDRLIHTLIGIMQYCEDTNIIHRHSFDTLRKVQDLSKGIMNLGGMRTTVGKNAIAELTREFEGKNISPGGSADLLALTVFFNLVKESDFWDKT